MTQKSPVLIILAKDTDENKLIQIFNVFDIGNNDSFTINEFNYMIKNFLLSIDEMNNVFCQDSYIKSDISENIKQEIVNLFDFFSFI